MIFSIDRQLRIYQKKVLILFFFLLSFPVAI